MFGRLSPWERQLGRPLRSPDGHPPAGGEGGEGGEGGDPAAAAAAAAEAAKGAAPKPGDAPKSWLEGLSLPDDVRDHATIKKYAASPESLLRGMIHLEGHLGVPPEQLIRLPKPDDVEANAALWNRLGRPETPDKFEVKLAEGSDLDKAGLDSFLATLHKAGPMTPPMAQAAADWYEGFAKQTAEAADKLYKAEQDRVTLELKHELGGAFEQTIDAAAEAAERFGGPEFAKFLKESGQGNDPRAIKAWAAVAKAAGEPGSPDPAGKRKAGEPGVMTPAEAEAALAKYSDTNAIEYKALMDQNHPQHDFYVGERNKLFQQKRGAAPR
jgi:hypothetical protein